MKKAVLTVMILSLLLVGCKATQAPNISENPVGTEELDVLQVDFIKGYEKAEFTTYNSPAKDNGLGGKKIWCEGIVKNIYTDPFTYAELEGHGGIWHAALNLFPDESYIKLMGKTVVVRGAYGGFSNSFQQPVIQCQAIYEKEGREFIPALSDYLIQELVKDVVKTSEKPEDMDNGTLILSKTIETSYETGYKISREYAISDKDYKMYKEIMAILNSDYSRSENEILAGLTGQYGMSVSQLKNFLRDNMQDAIDRDNGKTVGQTTLTDKQIIACGEQVIKKTVTNSNTQVSQDVSQWEIDKTGLRYVLKTNFDAGECKDIPALIKIEFSDDYSQFELFQLKYDNKNVAL